MNIKLLSIGSRLTNPVTKLSFIHTKNVEPVLSPVPRYKGSRIAQSVETSNAESPTPMSIYLAPQGHGGLRQSQ